MQRIAIFALCAAVAVATAWLLLQSEAPRGTGEREQAGGRSAASASAAAEGGRVEPLQPGAQAQSPQRDRDFGPRSAAGFSDRGRAAGSALPGAQVDPRSAGPDATPEAVVPTEPFTGRSSEIDSGADAPLDAGAPAPMIAEQAPTEPDPESEPEVHDPSPDEPSDGSADDGQCGALSSAEIARRVDQALPDGSMPPDVLAEMRESEAQRICDQARIAADSSN